MFKKIALSLCFTLFLGLLSACSPEGFLHLKKTESPSTKKSENTEETTKKDAEITAPVALPPTFNNEPLKPGQTQTEYMPNGLPVLKPMKGINADALFSENIKNTGDRFNRVENAVVDLRKEFDTYKPSIVRLAAVEADIQNLIKELEILLQETPNHQQPLDLVNSPEAELQVEQLDPQPELPPDEQETAKVAHTPQPQATPPPEERKEPEKPPEKTKPEKPKPQKASLPEYDGIIAKDLRAGEHADKVRLVLDTNQKTDFSIDLDNEEKLIIIELPEARWLGKETKSFKYSKLLESYSVEKINGGKGTMIVLSLKKSTQIIQEKRLSPDGKTPYHRIYFDLKI